MCRFFLVVLMVLGSGPALRADDGRAPFYLREGDRVVFYGDSITEQKLYTMFVETFVLTRFPALNVTFINSGWGGDRVGGGLGGAIETRLVRDVLAYKPTVMTVMLGMNDGDRKPYDEGNFRNFADGYLTILDRVSKDLPQVRFTLIEPSPYDDITRPPDFEGGYNGTLLRFADFIKQTAASRKLTLVDFNACVNALLTKAYSTNSELAQNFVPDRVHPGAVVHLIMAEALLKAWNAPGLVSEVNIDAKNKRVVVAKEAKLDELSFKKSISWRQFDNRLPFPLEMSDPNTALAVASSDFVESMNQQVLKVSGLKKGAYQLKIDDLIIGVFTADELGAGINLALLATPMRKQAVQVIALTQKRNDLYFFRWRSIQVPMESEKDPAAAEAFAEKLREYDQKEEEARLQERAAAQPVFHRYELTPAAPQ